MPGRCFSSTGAFGSQQKVFFDGTSFFQFSLAWKGKTDRRASRRSTCCAAFFRRNVTLAFSSAVDQLPTTFDGHDTNSQCAPEQWRQDQNADACDKSNIPTWINFIEQFGTYYIVRLFAGGLGGGAEEEDEGGPGGCDPSRSW